MKDVRVFPADLNPLEQRFALRRLAQELVEVCPMFGWPAFIQDLYENARQ